MHDTNSALFACYILFIYFRGQNIARIEREMRSLGHTQFHRRILYPRGPKPGWIARYDWAGASPTGAVGVPPTMSPQGENSAAIETSRDAQIAQRPKRQAAPRPRGRDAHGSNRFAEWLKTVSPGMTWSWRHQQVIIEQLERVTRGECKRLMIFLPPRHGKSELVTVRYTAWRMQRDPSMNVILGSYNQRLADRFSRKIRKVIADSEALGESAVGGEQLAVTATAGHAGTLPGNAGALACMSAKHETGDKPISERQPNPPRTTANGRPPTANSSPFPFVSTRPANSVSEWETTAGGGFRSVGVGSGVTGFGASLIVIDDPIKSRAEAESETYREGVWDWFTDDLYTRLEPDGAIVLIQTRWHEDDLAGRLLREASEEGSEHWDVINLPALAEPSGRNTTIRECVDRAGDSESTGSPPSKGGVASDAFSTSDDGVVKGRQASAPPTMKSLDWREIPDEPLCPERFNKQALNRIRARLGEYSFSALYQQRPTPADGGVFKREWFRIAPFAPPGLKWKRGYDLAVSTKTNADFTASFRCAFDKEGNLYISGGFRARIEYPDQRRFIIDRIKTEPDTEHGIELALHGQALIQDLRREPTVRGHLLRGVKPESDKLTRALTWAPLAEEGKVFLVRNAECGLRSLSDLRRPGVSSPHASKGSSGHSTHQNEPIPSTSEIPQSALRIPHSNWIPDFLDEICAFPNAAHDDQVDAVSLAVQMLKRPGRRAWGF